MQSIYNLQPYSFDVMIENQNCFIELTPYQVYLRAPFGTSHSLTQYRINALFKISYDNEVGYGESGLPPKNQFCYFSDYQDCYEFLDEFHKLISSFSIDQLDKNPFDLFDNNDYFQIAKEIIIKDRLVYTLLTVLDKIQKERRYASPRAGLECAILDLFGKRQKLSVCQMMSQNIWENISENYLIPSCFTISLLETPQKAIETIDQGLNSTCFFKIKVGNDLNYVMEVLDLFYKRFNQNYQGMICLDCNCSWTPQLCLDFLNQIQNNPIKQYLYMLEQPFPTDFIHNFNNIFEWKQVKERYQNQNIHIIADESMNDADDLDKLLPYVTGVNVKLEKAGGIRDAVLTLIKAQKLGLQKWIGQMISSQLNTTAVAHISGLTDKMVDLDGPLHVIQNNEKFTGGFKYGDQDTQCWGKLKLLRGYGFCLNMK